MTEEWRPVVGYEEIYEVSDLGRVRSLDRYLEFNTKLCGQHRRLYRGTIILPRADRYGYPTVNLYRQGSGMKTKKVHALVAEAFHGPRPVGKEVRHLDGDHNNNTPMNLAWGTHLENHDDRARHGRLPAGERSGRTWITEDQVREIRKKRESGATLSELAKEYGYSSRGSIAPVVNGKTWRHL